MILDHEEESRGVPMNAADLLRVLLKVEKVAEACAALNDFIASNEVTWAPVGGRPNNSGIIQVAGDPARALVERITNAIDAVIEREHHKHQGRPECESPKDAATAWLGVPHEGLHKLSPVQARHIAEESVRLLLLEGDGRTKRTVEIADHGIGVKPEEMARTILSLNEGNKLKKFYLAGAFGQGGSASFASCELTLVASRSVLSPESVAFTLVRYDPPAGAKLGSYVYLTCNGNVLVTDTKAVDFDGYSTRVRHFGYDLDDYPSPVGPRSLYGRCQNVLFEPVIPFILDSRLHNYRRTIKGSRTALNGTREEGDPDSKLSHAMPLFHSDLGDLGRIGIEYWVLEPNTKSAPNDAFVNGSKPIILSVNGQAHAEWSAVLLRKEANLLHLASRMVVHVNCNHLSLDTKRALFVSNREESRKGLAQNAIRQELLGALRSDERLAELNEQARLAGMKQKDAESEKEVRKEVARMLRLFGFSVTEQSAGVGGKSGEGDTTRAPVGSRPRKPRPPIPLVDPPTMLDLLTKDPITFYPGQRRFLPVVTNAGSMYHDATEPKRSCFSFHVSDASLRVAGSTPLKGGHLRLIIACDDAAIVGSSGKIVVELRPPNAPTLSVSRQFVVAAKPESARDKGTISLPEIDIQPVDSMDSEEWVTLGWPKDPEAIGADYVASKNALTIRYSTVFPKFREAVDHFTRRGAESAKSFQRRLEIWLITSVLIHWQDVEADTSNINHLDLDQNDIDEIRKDELRRLTKAAIVYARRDTQLALDESQKSVEDNV